MTINSLNFDAQALREKILDLAMRGKLVKQDPNDEPASVLLEKIKAEKDQLVKEKKIKKTKPLAPITDEEKPFDIPDSWEWVRLGDIGELKAGKTPKKSDITSKGIYPYFKVKEMNDPKNALFLKYTDQYVGDSYERNIFPANTIVFPKNGGAVLTRKKRVLSQDSLVDLNTGALIGSKNLDNKFLFYLFSSIDITKYIKGSTIPTVDSPKLSKRVIGLPPLEEQSRIADKIAQLFALLRKVESSNDQYVELQQMLHDKVLDLAMRGKLVEQDPNDEPASELLEKIKAEKAQLVKEKKIKKTKPLPLITDEEKPFDIPDSWEWARLGDVNTYNGHSVHPDKMPDEIFELYSVPIYPTGHPEIVQGKEIKSNKQTVNKDDILLCKINPRINRVWKVLDITENDNIASTEWIVLRQDNILPDYFRYGLMAPYFRKLLQSNVSGVGGSLTRAKPKEVQKYIFPLPPLEEQKRIVRKIEQLSNFLKVKC
ncbi:restriction endonuclease subunit S [Lactobacillus sp.]|uniref:restriction endonuclease subunit S n=1 Tax=Lactobacillus sp. TaxID=1591 RepID=UPI001982F1FD|nr:restriction endonuclease subunit S [Lactobacillus sp.]MBD5429142.1 restriction endonuclease subunit S [Lactobacillus sp.]